MMYAQLTNAFVTCVNALCHPTNIPFSCVNDVRPPDKRFCHMCKCSLSPDKHVLHIIRSTLSHRQSLREYCQESLPGGQNVASRELVSLTFRQATVGSEWKEKQTSKGRCNADAELVPPGGKFCYLAREQISACKSLGTTSPCFSCNSSGLHAIPSPTPRL